MLKDLFIQNLILMESCELEFDSRLNVITGETGSGKTAILHALKLLLGQKLDVGLIRRGADKGLIQARFELAFPKKLQALLEENGIATEDSFLILSREISIEGKSKNSINDKWVTLSLLQKVGSYCVQIVDQSSSEELRKGDRQKETLDSFAGIISEVEEFASLFGEEKALQKEKLLFEEKERQREREEPFYLHQLQELEEMQLQEGEEESLFQEYSQMSKAEEVSSQMDQIFDLISQGPGSILTKLQQSKTLCRPFTSLHPAFEESISLIEAATLSIKEVSHALTRALSSFDPDPKKREALESKLTQIDQMKRKYGPSLKDWALFKKDLTLKLLDFSELEMKQQQVKERIESLEHALKERSLRLSEQRTQAAKVLEQLLTLEIQSLNMQGARVEIHIEKDSRSSSGEDLVEFWLAANQGEKIALLKEASSGGELARLLLALKLCLAEKNHTPTLIFDEIDAGVGGETARLIGEKLKTLSLHRQIICITHFPQVACEAHLHLKIEKIVEGERTIAQVARLGQSSKEQELLRMLGGKKTLSFYKKS